MRALLGFVLCFLAATFAVEAKVAWYGPFTGPGSDVRAAKALPMNAPRLEEQGARASGTEHTPLLFALLAAGAAGLLAGMAGKPQRHENRTAVRVVILPCFSPPLYLRPPPVF